MRRSLVAWLVLLSAAAVLSLVVVATMAETQTGPDGSRVVRDRTHALSVTVPHDWLWVRDSLTPSLARSESSILSVATFRPRPRRGRGCLLGLPEVRVGRTDALVHVQEELDAQPGNLPRRPRSFRLGESLCRHRPEMAGLRASFRAHGRLLHVAALAGERAGAARRRELLGVVRSLRFGPVPLVKVRVRPVSGGPRTRFRLAFRATHRSVRRGRRERGYFAVVRGPARIACVVENEAPFSDGPPGARVRAVLDPSRTKGGRWCRGRFTGTVRYRDAICGRDLRCDRVYTRRAGRFSFTVR
jgi:hypothetical protein